jgi:hypothetical protein
LEFANRPETLRLVDGAGVAARMTASPQGPRTANPSTCRASAPCTRADQTAGVRKRSSRNLLMMYALTKTFAKEAAAEASVTAPTTSCSRGPAARTLRSRLRLAEGDRRRRMLRWSPARAQARLWRTFYWSRAQFSDRWCTWTLRATGTLRAEQCDRAADSLHCEFCSLWATCDAMARRLEAGLPVEVVASSSLRLQVPDRHASHVLLQ